MKRLMICIFISLVANPGAAPASTTIYRLAGGADAAQDIARRIQEIIDNIEAMAKSLIGDISGEVEERLDQADVIIDEAIAELLTLPADAEARALAVLRETEASLSMLETTIFQDVKSAIRQVECVAVTSTDNAQDIFGAVGDVLNTGQIKISPPLPEQVSWWCDLSPFCDGDQRFEIYSNFEQTSKDITRYMLEALSGMSDDDPATAIPETYRYLALLARRTSCHTGGSADDPWAKDHIAYTKAATDWERIVNPSRGLQ